MPDGALAGMMKGYLGILARKRKLVLGKQPTRKSDSGSTLIMVLCITMVIAVLSLSLLLAASSLLAAGKRSSEDEQCRIMAESVARQIDRELTDRFYPQLPSGLSKDESLWGYVGVMAGEEKEKRTFRLDNGNNENWPKEAGTVTVSLLCLGGDGRNRVEEDEPNDGGADFRDKDLELHVEITCANGSGAYTLTNIYHKVNGEEENSWKWSGLVERK